MAGSDSRYFTRAAGTPTNMTANDLMQPALNFRREPQVENCFDPFIGGGIIDPLALWALDRLIKGREIRQIMFFLDWMPSSQVGKKDSNTSLKKCVEYCEDYWNTDPAEMQGKTWKKTQEDADMTFSFLMWSPWSRKLLSEGHCLPVNSLWGVRTFTTKSPATGFLLSARDTIILPIIRQTEAKTIYVCHAWLRDERLIRDLPDATTYLNHPSTGAKWLMKKTVK